MGKKRVCLYPQHQERPGLSGTRASVFASPKIEGLWVRAQLVKGPNYPKPPPEKVCDHHDVARLLPHLRNRVAEEFVAIPFGSDMRPRGVIQIAKGGVDSAMVDVAEVARAALMSGSSRVMVVHNHPSGNLQSSAEDRRMAARLSMGLTPLGVELVDSVIIGPGHGATSLREEGSIAG